jgi:hypothetical protein
MNSIENIYTPSKWGEEYHSLQVWEALGAGSAGPGKSTVLRAEPLVQAKVEHERCLYKEHPHHMNWGDSVGWALYMRRTRPRQEQNISIAHRLYKAVDPDVGWNEKKGIFTFKSGYKVQFGACMDPDDWMQYYSSEYTLILFDELVEFLEEQFVQITGRCRTSDPVLKPMLKIRSMSNPVMLAETGVSSRDPNWVRKRYVDPAPEGRVILNKKIEMGDGSIEYKTRMYLPATLYDNPDPGFVRQYEATLRDKPTHIQQALLFGDWYVTVGSYYADVWDPKYHKCKPFRIPDSWPRFRALDWGFKTHGTIGWFAIDPDGNLFCEREFNFIGMLVPDVAVDIKRIEKRLGLWRGNKSRITGPADTQLWEERGDKGLSKIKEFEKAGIRWVQADKSKGSRQRHSERITARLKDHRNGTTTAGLVFFNSCVKCIQTIPAIQADPNNVEVVVKGGDDHWHDMVSYAVSYASKGRVGVSIDDMRIIHDEDREDENDMFAEQRGQTGYGI